MTLKIFWTPDAEKSFQKILLYIEETWTVKEKEKFISKSQKVFHLISVYPGIFKKSFKKNIRLALITKHTILIYRVKKQSIEFLLFWDTRQNPAKLKY